MHVWTSHKILNIARLRNSYVRKTICSADAFFRSFVI